MTARKCQGETLDQVIIDFGPNLELKIKDFICPGSFYVALTRVREGCKVFLKSFDKSYIKVNKKIEEKVEAMKKYRKYIFRKIYLDQKIFVIDNDEIKVGYLNINGLIDGNHAHYLNADHNLKHLDLLVIAETKLDEKDENMALKEALSYWNIIGRYDAEDGKKHMGLMILTTRKSLEFEIQSITHQTTKRNDKLQIQRLIVRLINGLNFGFIYCRSTPSSPEIEAIEKSFDECNFVLGDFNLSHRSSDDQVKIQYICGSSKVNALHEITHSISNNQLDYILIDQKFVKHCFVNSYNNFICDHKSICVRVGINQNEFTDEIREKLSFDEELHLKERKEKEFEDQSSSNPIGIKSLSSPYSDKSDQKETRIKKVIPKRSPGLRNKNKTPKTLGLLIQKFDNTDMATCWLTLVCS